MIFMGLYRGLNKAHTCK